MDSSSTRQLRLLAPLVLVAFAVALLVVIAGSGGSTTTAVPTKAMLEKQHDLGLGQYAGPGAKAARPRAPAASQSGQYIVKAGDTLGSIAQRNGVSVSQLQRLNPRVDPQALISGQKLRLR